MTLILDFFIANSIGITFRDEEVLLRGFVPSCETDHFAPKVDVLAVSTPGRSLLQGSQSPSVDMVAVAMSKLSLLQVQAPLQFTSIRQPTQNAQAQRPPPETNGRL